MPITPTFLHDVETGLRVIQNQDFQRLTQSLYWRKLAKLMPTKSAKERLIFMLDTAGIQLSDKLVGGVHFEELLSTYTEYEVSGASAGLKIPKVKLEDIDNNGIEGGEGIKQATAWVRQITAKSAYWPQQQVMAAIRNGDQAGFTTYDGKKFFDAAHPNNVFDSGAGTFTNLLTGAASGVFPGACPIDASVTLDVAFVNLYKAINYIEGSLLMPDGVSPRFLKVNGLWVPSALKMRAQQILNARVIPQAATGGAGSADVEAIIRNWGLGEPNVGIELGAAFANGSDTSYYLTAEGLTSDDLGAITYLEREPFGIVYNTGITDAELQRANDVQYTTRGRNGIGYGHPFLLFKVRST
jgi:phage major head subunit gpT-like protein